MPLGPLVWTVRGYPEFPLCEGRERLDLEPPSDQVPGSPVSKPATCLADFGCRPAPPSNGVWRDRAELFNSLPHLFPLLLPGEVLPSGRSETPCAARTGLFPLLPTMCLPLGFKALRGAYTGCSVGQKGRSPAVRVSCHASPFPNRVPRCAKNFRPRVRRSSQSKRELSIMPRKRPAPDFPFKRSGPFPLLTSTLHGRLREGTVFRW